jgi:hypothetical protein
MTQKDVTTIRLTSIGNQQNSEIEKVRSSMSIVQTMYASQPCVWRTSSVPTFASVLYYDPVSTETNQAAESWPAIKSDGEFESVIKGSEVVAMYSIPSEISPIFPRFVPAPHPEPVRKRPKKQSSELRANHHRSWGPSPIRAPTRNSSPWSSGSTVALLRSTSDDFSIEPKPIVKFQRPTTVR